MMKHINICEKHEYSILHGGTSRNNYSNKSTTRTGENYDRLSIKKLRGTRQNASSTCDRLVYIKHSENQSNGSLTDDEKRAIRLDKSIRWLREEVVSTIYETKCSQGQ